MRSPLPVLLDVDTGIDDALALLLATLDPRFELRAVTCVNGNAGLERVVKNTCEVLAVAGANGVEIGVGAQRALVAPALDASYVHGENGLANLDLAEMFPQLRSALAAAKNQVSELNAVELLRRESERGDLTVVALGPLTNLALFIRTHPQNASKIRRIVTMCGAISRGNATAVAEFNLMVDPEAADIVFNSGIPVTMYGLEPFYQAALTRAEIDRIDGGAAAHLATQLLRFLEGIYVRESRVQASSGVATIGDAGALLSLVLPHATRRHTVPVRVELEGTYTRGMTVVDCRHEDVNDPFLPQPFTTPLIDVITDIDTSCYVAQFIAAMRS